MIKPGLDTSDWYEPFVTSIVGTGGIGTVVIEPCDTGSDIVWARWPGWQTTTGIPAALLVHYNPCPMSM